eukprot:5176189-Amphidinium_carterae.1
MLHFVSWALQTNAAAWKPFEKSWLTGLSLLSASAASSASCCWNGNDSAAQCHLAKAQGSIEERDLWRSVQSGALI